jgi:hypothetical protein
MKEITAETRWLLAARSASRLPVLCTAVLRTRLGEAYDDHLTEEIWCHLGDEACDLAKGLGLQVDTADRLAEGLLEILRTLFGSEFRWEILDLPQDRAVILINRCPILMRALELGEGSPEIFHPCLAFCVSAAESLHQDFSVRFIRAMCLGDRNCELRIAKKEELEKNERVDNRNSG